jgi:hypothetical protein
MNRFRFPLVALAVALGACGSDTPTGPTVVSVTVTPATATLPAVGATVQFTARANDAGGTAVTGLDVTWASSDQGVATVSTTGVATGVSVGTAAITATVGGVAGSAVVTVQQCEATAPVSLSRGESQAFETSDCLVIPSGANGDRYRVVVLQTNTGGSASDIETVTLRVAGLGVLQAPAAVVEPTPVVLREPIRFDSRVLAEAVRRADANARAHMRRLEEDAALVRALDGSGLLRTREVSAAQAAARAPSPERYVFDLSRQAQCQTDETYKRVAHLLYENDDLAVYQDSIQKATNPMSVSLARQLADYYADHGRDLIASYFGEPTDIDGNGKLVLLAHPSIDGNWDDAIAQVLNRDFFSVESCASSNEMEIMYFDTDLILSMEDGNFQALSTVVHEAEHVVVQYHRIAELVATGSYEAFPLWIQEGMAEIAAEMSSRLAWAANGGPAPGGAVGLSDFAEYQQATGSAFDERTYGTVIMLARTANYLGSQPNGLVVAPDHADNDGSEYSSGWLFNRWMGDAYGGAGNAPLADSAFFRVLTDSLTPVGLNGFVGIEQQTGRTLLELIDEFTVAVSLHGTTVPSSLDFTTYDFVTGAEIFCSPNPLGEFPWPVTTTGTAGDCDANIEESFTVSAPFRTNQFSGPIGATGMRIHDFVSNGTGTGMQMELDMSRPGKILVVRVQ